MGTKSMRRAELEAVTRKWISLWDSPSDWELFDRLHADDFEDMSHAGRGPSKLAFALGLKGFIEAFPDVKTMVEDVVVDERAQRVAVRWRSVGTNAARYLGVGPTNRKISITGIEIIEIAAGRVRRRWGEWDISAHLAGARGDVKL